ncbi:uncharacterized protein LACBIDRAFT_334747 [Laccaria bicolor S238N-H82]|uniref:Predicted protein n=1 Tax=Laccaria bicolor (strain S238N-H82 / ATCC MYA-4686) TaxID=486041 RepID=B0E059_LACBS|nr:uncharacterized protein LACBIDRAFT_334747 [Laccaria bicolor S238N-H82]EDQ99763.1 predicted protein [Laccaria bicolor S238N-H82]|eukprot:XP_001889599.1 predicted protein [Laccaria bicolor S238N-H82]
MENEPWSSHTRHLLVQDVLEHDDKPEPSHARPSQVQDGFLVLLEGRKLMLGYSGEYDRKNTLDIWYHLLDYVYTAFHHAHMEIPTKPKTIWFVPFFPACPLLMTLPYPGTSTTSTPSSAMLIWRLPLPSSPCPNSELIHTRWRWQQSHRRFRRAYIFNIWAERAFKFWITGVSTAGILDRKEEAKFSEDNWGASTSILSTNCREDNSCIEGIGIGTVNERNGSFWFLHERA